MRKLGLTDAVSIGLGSMIGAGVFSAIAPASAAAGTGVLVALAIAALIAWCNAMSSARLAAVYPQSGGTYIYGQRRLGEFPGFLAGWCFVIGKSASCVAMALVFASYAVPDAVRPVAAAAIVALTALNLWGVTKSALATRVIVGCTLTVLSLVIVAGLSTTTAAGWARLSPHELSAWGVLQAAGLLFFAFAGYARIATLGGEVHDPTRTIPRAIGIALAITLVTYLLVAVAVLVTLGPAATAGSTAPLTQVASTAGWTWLVPVVRIGAALAALGALLTLILGVSRTARAMVDGGHLPAPIGNAALLGAVMVAVASLVDLRGAIGFSSFAVLLYYAVANLSAMTLRRSENPLPRWVPALGLTGCLVLVVTLPWQSVVAGVGVVTIGALWFTASRRWRSGAGLGQ